MVPGQATLLEALFLALLRWVQSMARCRHTLGMGFGRASRACGKRREDPHHCGESVALLRIAQSDVALYVRNVTGATCADSAIPATHHHLASSLPPLAGRWSFLVYSILDFADGEW